MRSRRYQASVVACLLVCLACEKQDAAGDDTGSAATTEPSASAAATAAVDSDMAHAVAEVTKANQGAAPAASNGPPADGLLGPQRANAEAPIGSPAKLSLAQSGAEPKVQLGGPEVTTERVGQLTVSARTGPSSALPSVSLKLSIRGEEPQPEEPVSAVVVKVTAAGLAPQQPGTIPEQLRKSLLTLAGSTFTYRSKAGLVYGAPVAKLAEGASPQLETLLQAANDALSMVVVAYPTEPVGVGAIWMVTAREQLGLADVVAYHLYQVEAIKQGRVTLSVKTQRYIATPSIQGNAVMRFQASGAGEMLVVPGNRLPIEGRVEQSLQALVVGPSKQPQPVQWDLRALFSFPPQADSSLVELEAKLRERQGAAPGKKAGPAASSVAKPNLKKAPVSPAVVAP